MKLYKNQQQFQNSQQIDKNQITNQNYNFNINNNVQVTGNSQNIPFQGTKPINVNNSDSAPLAININNFNNETLDNPNQLNNPETKISYINMNNNNKLNQQYISVPQGSEDNRQLPP